MSHSTHNRLFQRQHFCNMFCNDILLSRISVQLHKWSLFFLHRFGSKARRIFRILYLKKRLEQKQVCWLVFEFSAGDWLSKMHLQPLLLIILCDILLLKILAVFYYCILGICLAILFYILSAESYCQQRVIFKIAVHVLKCIHGMRLACPVTTFTVSAEPEWLLVWAWVHIPDFWLDNFCRDY